MPAKHAMIRAAMAHGLRWLMVFLVLRPYVMERLGHRADPESLLTYGLLLGFGLLQFLYSRDGTPRRVMAEIAAESVLVAGLTVMYADRVPQVVLLFLPVILRCGRNLPSNVGLPALAAVACLMVFGHRLAGYGFEASVRALDPGWFIVYAIGWMIRSQTEEHRMTQTLLNQIKRQQAALEEAHTELIQYALEAEESAVLRERTRLAGEIHDTVGHTLTTVIRGLDACGELVRTSPDEAERHLLSLRGAAKDGLEEIRRAVRSMQEIEEWFAARDWQGLLERFAASVKMTSGVKIGIVQPSDVPPSKRYAVYQCIKEAVTNAIRHGKASDITILQRESGGFAQLMIMNNGSMASEPIEPGIGLSGMERRMRSVGGSVTFDSADDSFRVILSWPADGQPEMKEDGG
ncbi:sensor histidine kinase [Paenibacillus elgii]|uniref:sensor histidine kinase n=1 Tax=Paenibacillus elgii TaxID=189691 RepID=UPI00203CE5E0|nr:histidine kinase [Paenibacillus elgii]MCM3268500.1 histidine kinase [Paenibacillus elgii]